jgi:methionyl-tRNA formyltransferase
MKIIFMGTPEFAVASLDAIVKAGYEIAAVITAPDKPSGRGQKVNESAVKQYAEKNGLKILQPVKLKDPDFINELKNLNADLQVVVAFRMLPEVVWNMPSKGTINLHGSLLPQYRGLTQEMCYFQKKQLLPMTKPQATFMIN